MTPGQTKYHRKKRFRFTNKHLIAPNTYYKRAMKYWAKDSLEAHKLLKAAQREIKELNKIIANYEESHGG
jgi:hypothetical protein